MIRRLKNLVKRLVPVSWHRAATLETRVLEVVSEVRTEVEAVRCDVSKVCAAVLELSAPRADECVIGVDSEDIRLGRGLYYNYPSEKVKTREYFLPILDDPEFPAIYQRLISGMDVESARTVSLIVNNLRLSLAAEDGAWLDVFTEEEKASLRRQKQELYRSVVHMPDGTSVYGRYRLPIPVFEPQIFWEEMGYGEISPDLREAIRTRDILDVGGYVGDTMIVMSRWTDRRVFVFEPDTDKIGQCRQTMAWNGVRNAEIVPLALGNDVSEQVFHVSPTSAGSFFARKGIPYSEERRIQTMPLDDYMADREIDVGLIKVDIEGFEQQFLEGARKTIARFRPVILLSIYHKGSDFFTLKPLIESWGLDYRFKIWKPRNGRLVGETMLICEPRGS